jgi:hypothetical protein
MATENGTTERAAVANPETGDALATDPKSKGKGKAVATEEEQVEDTSMVDDDDDDDDDDELPEEVSVHARSRNCSRVAIRSLALTMFSCRKLKRVCQLRAVSPSAMSRT